MTRIDREHITTYDISCTIGRGFGYMRDNIGKLIWRTHNFGVVIEDNVRIERSSVIDGGRWRDTVIGEGTAIHCLCHVGHNTEIGKNCILTAGTIIAGSCNIGDNCYFGINSTIVQGITIGNNCIIGAGAVVISDVKDGEIVVGNPAHPIENNLTDKEYYNMVGKRKV